MLEITEVANQKIGEVLKQQSEPVYGLRVSVVPGGCSGFQYAMSLATGAEDGDWIGEYGGVKVLVDPQSAPFLSGARIDFVETLEASGFRITNPNAVSGCGCGKSFHTRESEHTR